MQNLALRIPIWGKSKAQLNFRPPVMFSVENWQCSQENINYYFLTHYSYALACL